MLRTLGLLFLALIVAAGIGFGGWMYLDRQARDFVVATTPIVFKNWNVDAVTHRSASVLQTPEFESNVHTMFQAFSPQLGPLVSAEPPIGWLRYGRADPKLPSGLYGKYKSSAKFQKADAELEFLVIREDGAWRVAGFWVSSPALFEVLQKKAPAGNSGPDFMKGPPEEEAAVLAEAEAILRLMDSEDPGASWHRASLLFQEATPKRRFVREMDRMRKMTGHMQNRKLQGIGFRLDFQAGTPPGDYAIADFLTTYSKATVEERLGFYRKEGQWKFSAHKWRRIDQK